MHSPPSVVGKKAAILAVAAALLTPTWVGTAAAEPRPVTAPTPERTVLTLNTAQVDALQRRVAPPRLIQRHRKIATPTRWCRHHRPSCLKALTHRYVRAFKAGRLGYTRWSDRARKKIRPTFVREYRALCRDSSLSNWSRASSGDGRPTSMCPRSAGPQSAARPASQAWSRYRSRANCALAWIPYAGQPGYHMICKPHAPAAAFSIGRPGQEFLACEAAALATAGTVGAFGAVPGAAATFASGSVGCGVLWAFAHFLDW